MEKMTRITYGYFLCHSTTEKFIAIPLKFYVIVINWKKKVDDLDVYEFIKAMIIFFLF